MKAKLVASVFVEEDLPRIVKGMFVNGVRLPRVALLGRSNVGKSSLVNALVGAAKAKTSKTPGKTKAIDFFEIEDLGILLIDLPGYGFAKRTQQEKDSWSSMIEGYLELDEHLAVVLVLLDSRHGPTDVDLEALKFLAKKKIPECVWIMTKSDQLKTQSDRAKRKKEIELLAGGSVRIEAPRIREVLWTSAQEKEGFLELSKVLKQIATENKV